MEQTADIIPLFNQSPTDCARELLGWEITKDGVCGRIVETEAYSEIDDRACHTFFRRTAREFVAKHDAGAVYIYLNYGVYWLLNVMTQSPTGERGFVLVRALEPLSGIEQMHQRRRKTRALKDRDLCSGPGKLTIALGIDASDHEMQLGGAGCSFSLSAGSLRSEENLISGTRIGITKDAHLPWRYGIAGNAHLSRPF